jgi:hypothetical protein
LACRTSSDEEAAAAEVVAPGRRRTREGKVDSVITERGDAQRMQGAGAGRNRCMETWACRRPTAAHLSPIEVSRAMEGYMRIRDIEQMQFSHPRGTWHAECTSIEEDGPCSPRKALPSSCPFS